VAEGVVDDISHEGLRVLLRAEGVTFQRLKTWKISKDPRYAAKKARVEQMYAIADREATGNRGWKRACLLWVHRPLMIAAFSLAPVFICAVIHPLAQWAAASFRGSDMIESGLSPPLTCGLPGFLPQTRIHG
jgi:hypothetical protein